MSDRQTNDDELTLDSVRESGYYELNTLEEVKRFKKLSLLSSVARFSAVYLTLKTVLSLKHRKLDIHSNVASVISISSCSSCFRNCSPGTPSGIFLILLSKKRNLEFMRFFKGPNCWARVNPFSYQIKIKLKI